MMKTPRGYWQQSAEKLAVLHLESYVSRPDGYIQICRNGRLFMLHRWIWMELVGPIPIGHEIDHWNGIRHDCRLDNIRCVPASFNKRNRKMRSDNTSGITGVCRTKIAWQVSYTDPILNKPCRKQFNIAKLGENGAKDAAIAFRKAVITELVEDFGYTPRHGQ